jgi:hypothetical protein
MGGTFDRRTRQPELVGGGVVVHTRVAVVLLLGQHLARRPQRPDERVAVAGDRCVERGGHAVQYSRWKLPSAHCDILVSWVSPSREQLTSIGRSSPRESLPRCGG